VGKTNRAPPMLQCRGHGTQKSTFGQPTALGTIATRCSDRMKICRAYDKIRGATAMEDQP
jgi:hypothetical protein